METKARNQEDESTDASGLLALRKGFSGQAGQADIFATWTGTHPCRDGWLNVACDDDIVRVVNITLGYDKECHRIEGVIASEIATITMLQRVDFSCNYLRGTLPSQIGLLANLRYLNVSNNYLTGRLPSELGRLAASLAVADVSENYLRGAVPTQMGLLTSLRVLDASINALTGSIPSQFGGLSSLQDLTLSFNRLKGSVPQEVLALTALEVLQISHNTLTGDAPLQALARLPGLRVLDVSFNKVSGTIPNTLTVQNTLETLQVSGNDVTGSLPAAMGTIAMLDRLSVVNNRLTGPIPSMLGRLANLRTLEVSGNRLAGNLTTELGLLVRLTNLDVSNNLFSGTLPSEYGLLTKAEFMAFERNRLTGPVPSELGLLVQRPLLDVSHNLFTTIDADTCALNNVRFTCRGLDDVFYFAFEGSNATDTPSCAAKVPIVANETYFSCLYFQTTFNPSRDSVQCRFPTRCPGNGFDVCVPPYGGYQCLRCTAGYFSFNDTCVKCAKGVLQALQILAFGLLVVFFFAIVFHYARKAKNAAQLQYLPIFLFFAQVIGQASTKFNLQMPEPLQTFVGVASTPGSFFSIEMIGPECLLPIGTAFVNEVGISYLLMWLARIAFVFICILLYSVFVLAQIDVSYVTRIQGLKRGLSLISLWMFIPFTSIILEPFVCRPKSSSNWSSLHLYSAPEIHCSFNLQNGVAYIIMFPVSVILLFTVEFRAIRIAFLKFRKSSMMQNGIVQTTSEQIWPRHWIFLPPVFIAERSYWIRVRCLRSLVVGGLQVTLWWLFLVSAFDLIPVLQYIALVIASVALVYAIAALLAKPYEDPACLLFDVGYNAAMAAFFFTWLSLIPMVTLQAGQTSTPVNTFFSIGITASIVMSFFEVLYAILVFPRVFSNGTGAAIDDGGGGVDAFDRDNASIAAIAAMARTHWISYMHANYIEPCWYWEMVRILRSFLLVFSLIIPMDRIGVLANIGILLSYAFAVQRMRPNRTQRINNVDCAISIVCAAILVLSLFGLINPRWNSVMAWITFLIIATTTLFMGREIAVELRHSWFEYNARKDTSDHNAAAMRESQYHLLLDDGDSVPLQPMQHLSDFS